MVRSAMADKLRKLLFALAGRVVQRASGAWIYLIDGQGRSYSPESDPSAVPLDVLLQPHESVTTSRIFHVPADVHGLGLLTGHSGSYCGPMKTRHYSEPS